MPPNKRAATARAVMRARFFSGFRRETSPLAPSERTRSPASEANHRCGHDQQYVPPVAIRLRPSDNRGMAERFLRRDLPRLVVAVGLGMLAGTIACGLIVMGAAKGIGGIAGRATEAIARQPEAGGRIFTTMIIAAALIEGVTLFALIICLMAVL